MKYGNLSEEEALRLITLNPAIQLKVDQRVGSIDVGKDADLVLFNGHPFSVYSRPEMTMIEGEVYFDRKQDLVRREQLAKEKKALIEKEKKQPGAAQPTQPAPVVFPTEVDEDDLDGHNQNGKPHRKN